MNNSKNHHILNSASNLLGFSLLAITTLHGMGVGKDNFVDDFAGLQILFFAGSVIVSFLSIRTSNDVNAKRYENIADILFMLGLLILLIVVMFFVISFA
jgi:hypothetical protein